MLKVIPRKQKIMIFSPKTLKEIRWHQLQHRHWANWNCSRMHLFGYTFNSNEKLYSCTRTLERKSPARLSSIRKHTLLNRINPNTASQILDTMIFPILSYNSEIWGMYTKQNFKTWDSSPIEKIHLKFCKHYLGVNNKASNVTCRAELGRLPQ